MERERRIRTARLQQRRARPSYASRKADQVQSVWPHRQAGGSRSPRCCSGEGIKVSRSRIRSGCAVGSARKLRCHHHRSRDLYAREQSAQFEAFRDRARDMSRTSTASVSTEGLQGNRMPMRDWTSRRRRPICFDARLLKYCRPTARDSSMQQPSEAEETTPPNTSNQTSYA